MIYFYSFETPYENKTEEGKFTEIRRVYNQKYLVSLERTSQYLADPGNFPKYDWLPVKDIRKFSSKANWSDLEKHVGDLTLEISLSYSV